MSTTHSPISIWQVLIQQPIEGKHSRITWCSCEFEDIVIFWEFEEDNKITTPSPISIWQVVVRQPIERKHSRITLCSCEFADIVIFWDFEEENKKHNPLTNFHLAGGYPTTNWGEAFQNHFVLLWICRYCNFWDFEEQRREAEGMKDWFYETGFWTTTSLQERFQHSKA